MLVNPSDIVAKAKSTVTECSVEDANDCLNSTSIFIDIREPAEYQQGHVPGAIHLPRGLLEFEIHRLVEQICPNRSVPNDEQTIVLYCASGGRSALAAKTLEELGYKNVTSLNGGIAAWAQMRLPVVIPD